MHRQTGAVVMLAGLLWMRPADARESPQPQTPGPAPAPTGAAPSVDGPLAPVPPAVITRDTAGHATIRAVAVSTPIRIDGRLDEAVHERPGDLGLHSDGAAGGNAGEPEDGGLDPL